MVLCDVMHSCCTDAALTRLWLHLPHISQPLSLYLPDNKALTSPITSVHQHLILRADQSLGSETDINHNLQYSCNKEYNHTLAFVLTPKQDPMCSRSHNNGQEDMGEGYRKTRDPRIQNFVWGPDKI